MERNKNWIIDLKILSLQKVLNFKRGKDLSVNQLSSTLTFVECFLTKDKTLYVETRQKIRDSDSIVSFGKSEYDLLLFEDDTVKICVNGEKELPVVGVIKFPPLHMIFYKVHSTNGQFYLVPMKDYFKQELKNLLMKGVTYSEDQILERVDILTKRYFGNIVSQ